jgi:PAS domain S-box-containing protein
MRRPWKLQSSLTIIMVASAVWPVIVAAALGRLLLDSSSIHQGRERVEWGAYLLSRLARDRLNTTTRVVEGVASGLATVPPSNDREVLQFGIEADRKIRAIFILDQNLVTQEVRFADRFKLDERDFIGIDMSGDSAARRVLSTKKVSWSNTYLSPVDGLPVVSIAVPIENHIVYAQVELTSVQEIADFMAQSPELSASILDSAGTVVYDSDSRFMTQRVNLWNKVSVKRALNGQSGSMIEKLGGVESVVGYSPIPDIGWGIIVDSPRTSVLEAAYETERMLMGIAVLAALIASMIAIPLSRWMLKPLQSLIGATSQIAEGKMTVSLPESGADEIVRLSDSVQRMAKSIQEREQYLIQANVALQRSEDRYRSFVETAQEGIWAIDRDGVTVYVNPSILKNLGYGYDEMVGRSLTSFIYEEDLPSHRESIISRKALKSEVYERRIKCKSGEIRYFLVSASPILDDDGQFNGSFATLTDITDREEKERARIAYELDRQLLLERLQQQFDAMPVACISLDNELRITDWNPSAQRTFGVARNQVIGKNPGNWLVISSQSTAFIQWLRNLMDDVERKTFSSERNETDIVHCEWTKSPLIDAHGYVVGVLAIAQDVTEKTEAEQTVQTLNAELERRIDERTYQLAQANKELESFSYSVSHDLRAPLRAIDGFASIIIEDFAKQFPEDAQEYLNRIRLNATRMGTLIDDLLALSRLSRLELEKTTISLKDLVEDALEDILPQLKDREVQIQVDNGVTMVADPVLMKQVYVNLLSNAFKYSANVDSTLIEVGAEDREGQYTYYVKDNGVGFDMRFAGKIFEVFQRVHNQDEFEGTGIGLAIVQRIIRRHEGSVWADSAVGKGTTIYFTLPEH